MTSMYILKTIRAEICSSIGFIHKVNHFIKSKKLSYKASLFLIFVTAFSAQAQFKFDAEFGASFNTRNNVRYPNDENTTANLVDIPDQLGTGQTAFLRLRASYTINDRHTISGLYAPLTFNSSGSFSRPIKFGNSIYTQNEVTDVSYKFNSYRLTYSYQIVDRKKIKFGLGLTGKIRDARIGFNSGMKSDETTDLGFVPLINFRLDLYPTEKLIFTLNGDALVGPQGRAEDIFAGFEYSISDPIAIKLGYRILEGGADVDQVYNFSLIHYASVGVIFTIK